MGTRQMTRIFHAGLGCFMPLKLGAAEVFGLRVLLDLLLLLSSLLMLSLFCDCSNHYYH